MIVDAHAHYPWYLGNLAKMEDVADFLRVASKFGIGKLCLLGEVFKYGLYPDEKQITEINNLTAVLLKEYPDSFLGFCYINPSNSQASIEDEIDRRITEDKFKGLKLEASLNCRSPQMDPVMKRARMHECVVYQHTFYKTVDKVPEESDPSDVANLAARFPDVKIVMPHLACCGIRGVLDIENHKNVYVDTSGSQPVSGILEYAVEKLGADRILYGSDAPGRDFSCQLGRIYGAEISDEDKNKILNLNAANIFKLNRGES